VGCFWAGQIPSRTTRWQKSYDYRICHLNMSESTTDMRSVGDLLFLYIVCVQKSKKRTKIQKVYKNPKSVEKPRKCTKIKVYKNPKCTKIQKVYENLKSVQKSRKCRKIQKLYKNLKSVHKAQKMYKYLKSVQKSKKRTKIQKAYKNPLFSFKTKSFKNNLPAVGL